MKILQLQTQKEINLFASEQKTIILKKELRVLNNRHIAESNRYKKLIQNQEIKQKMLKNDIRFMESFIGDFIN